MDIWEIDMTLYVLDVVGKGPHFFTKKTAYLYLFCTLSYTTSKLTIFRKNQQNLIFFDKLAIAQKLRPQSQSKFILGKFSELPVTSNGHSDSRTIVDLTPDRQSWVQKVANWQLFYFIQNHKLWH